jgi:hypothetical protein
MMSNRDPDLSLRMTNPDPEHKKLGIKIREPCASNNIRILHLKFVVILDPDPCPTKILHVNLILVL